MLWNRITSPPCPKPAAHWPSETARLAPAHLVETTADGPVVAGRRAVIGAGTVVVLPADGPPTVAVGAGVVVVVFGDADFVELVHPARASRSKAPAIITKSRRRPWLYPPRDPIDLNTTEQRQRFHHQTDLNVVAVHAPNVPAA
jgi:hypothetical protein